eukprot:9632180-Alexandrium_andersonii.AAC.1
MPMFLLRLLSILRLARSATACLLRWLPYARPRKSSRKTRGSGWRTAPAWGTSCSSGRPGTKFGRTHRTTRRRSTK